jgi:hypothetical protein
MVWVSELEMKKSFRVSRRDIISGLDELHVLCPVNLGTIVFGELINESMSVDAKTAAYVYPST